MSYGRRIHACHMIASARRLAEEDTCMSYGRRIHACHREDTCMSYEEEDTCMSYDFFSSQIGGDEPLDVSVVEIELNPKP
jgi:hypothetical protein